MDIKLVENPRGKHHTHILALFYCRVKGPFHRPCHLCTLDPHGYMGPPYIPQIHMAIMGPSYVLSSDNCAKIRGRYPNHTHVHKTDPYQSNTLPWTDFMLTTNQIPPIYIKQKMIITIGIRHLLGSAIYI